MSFVENLKAELVTGEGNVAFTENGAKMYRTSGESLLDLNFSVTALRKASEQTIIKSFSKAFYDNKLLAMKWLFYCSDVREGLGERRVFRTCMAWIADNHSDLAIAVLPLIAEYSRWDNVICLLDTDLKNNVVELINKQLKQDIIDMKNNKPISLLAKWMPSINTSSKATVKHAKMLCKALNLTEKQYRKTLSTMRQYLDVVERKMSSKKWDDIDYSTVPSRANLLYNSAFLRNDEERRRSFLDKLKNGDKDVKINASVLYPHDIVASYLDNQSYFRRRVKSYDETLEQLWKNLKDTVNGEDSVMVVADSSGSMYRPINNTVNVSDVANALAIYFSERCNGQYKDKYITFSSSPKFVDLSGLTTLRDKIAKALSYNIVENTNIEATFDLILNTAINNNMDQSELPKTVLIISDMQFDQGTYGSRDERLFNNINKKFVNAGYKMPKIVYWNLCANMSSLPVTKHAKFPCALVSGYSTNIVKMVLSNDLDPWNCLLSAINNSRYDVIEEVIKDII